MIYIISYAILGIIFDLWIALSIGGWTESRLGKYGWILGFFLWPVFTLGEVLDWFLDKHDRGGLE